MRPIQLIVASLSLFLFIGQIARADVHVLHYASIAEESFSPSEQLLILRAMALGTSVVPLPQLTRTIEAKGDHVLIVLSAADGRFRFNETLGREPLVEKYTERNLIGGGLMFALSRARKGKRDCSSWNETSARQLLDTIVELKDMSSNSVAYQNLWDEKFVTAMAQQYLATGSHVALRLYHEGESAVWSRERDRALLSVHGDFFSDDQSLFQHAAFHERNRNRLMHLALEVLEVKLGDGFSPVHAQWDEYRVESVIERAQATIPYINLVLTAPEFTATIYEQNRNDTGEFAKTLRDRMHEFLRLTPLKGSEKGLGPAAVDIAKSLNESAKQLHHVISRSSYFDQLMVRRKSGSCADELDGDPF